LYREVFESAVSDGTAQLLILGKASFDFHFRCADGAGSEHRFDDWHNPICLLLLRHELHHHS
jgi:hypothetical protein